MAKDKPSYEYLQRQVSNRNWRIKKLNQEIEDLNKKIDYYRDFSALAPKLIKALNERGISDYQIAQYTDSNQMRISRARKPLPHIVKYQEFVTQLESLVNDMKKIRRDN